MQLVMMGAVSDSSDLRLSPANSPLLPLSAPPRSGRGYMHNIDIHTQGGNSKEIPFHI
jgi:hypothetical protein